MFNNNNDCIFIIVPESFESHPILTFKTFATGDKCSALVDSLLWILCRRHPPRHRCQLWHCWKVRVNTWNEKICSHSSLLICISSVCSFVVFSTQVNYWNIKTLVFGGFMHCCFALKRVQRQIRGVWYYGQILYGNKWEFAPTNVEK